VLRFISHVFVTLWLAFLTAAAILSHQPGPIEGVQLDTPPAKPPAQDLRERMEQAVLNRTTPLVLTEAEVNHYLAGIITGRETGVSRHLATFERIALSFDNKLCRVWLVWKAGDRTRTASVDLALRREKNQFVIEPLRGRYGRLPVFRGALAALIPALRHLCSELEEEPNNIIRPVFEMNAIRFEKGRVTLDPRFEAAR
jgi:hypothetical protein